jgi:hypothetical protein
MYSDYWLKSGYQHGKSIKVSTVVDYKIWIGNKGCVVGVTVDFEEADDYHYDLPIDEWMEFLTKILGDSNLENTPRLFRKFLYENKENLAFEDALNFYQIKYDKIAFY